MCFPCFLGTDAVCPWGGPWDHIRLVWLSVGPSGVLAPALCLDRRLGVATPRGLPLRGAEATSCLRSWGGGGGFDPLLGRRGHGKVRFLAASGVRAEIGSAAAGSQAEPATPFRATALGGPADRPDGIQRHLSEPQAHRPLWGPPPGPGSSGRPWPLAPVSLRGLGIGGDGQSPEHVGGCQVCGCGRERAGGGRTSPLTCLCQGFSGASRVRRWAAGRLLEI